MLQQAWHAVSDGMSFWYQSKMFIEHASIVSSDALHVLVGTVAWIIVALLARRPIGNSLPWNVLLFFTVFNEIVDFWVERWPDFGSQLGESAKDVLLTMALPTCLLLLARSRPALFAGARIRRSRR